MHHLRLTGFCLAATACLLVSCSSENEPQSAPLTDLPISGGILLSLHSIGGESALNDTIQVSDHWQLSSVGREHGWIRKLDADEQKQIVRAMTKFGSSIHHVKPDKKTGVRHTLVAKGFGTGEPEKRDLEVLADLLDTLVLTTEAQLALR